MHSLDTLHVYGTKKTPGLSMGTHCLLPAAASSCSPRDGNKLLSWNYWKCMCKENSTALFSKGRFVYKNTCEILLSCTQGKFPVAVFHVNFLGLQRSLQFLFLVFICPLKVQPASIFEHKILKFVYDSTVECLNTCPPWIELV